MPNNNSTEMINILRSASAQLMGAEQIAELDLARIVDEGKKWTGEQKEQWTKTLVERIYKTMYTDASYTDNTNDVFYENNAKFGAAMQVINIEMPEIQENSSWTAIQSGVTTIGSNIVYLPVVKEQLYGASTSWAVPVAYTGTQLNTAFLSEQKLEEFYNYLRLQVENRITYHRKVMSSLNRNNYIANKLAVANSTGKVNSINLVAEYAKFKGIDNLTVAEFLRDPDALRYSVHILGRTKKFITEMSTIFTTDTTSTGKFIPDDRLVFQVLEDFEGLMWNQTFSTTYHTNFIEMPLHRSVASWQGLTGDTASLDFNDISRILIKHGDGTVTEQTGVVALMCDKWAIMHTIVQNRVGVQRDDIKDITLNEFQFTDRYANNLTLNGVVFIVKDVTA